MKVLYFLPDSENPFWKEVVSGIRKVARTEGMEVELIGATHNPELQVTQVLAHADKKPEAVLITPLDVSAIAKITKGMMTSGVPVVAIDQNMSPNATASVISGNMKGGIMAATFIAEQLGEGKRVVRIRAEEKFQSASLRTSSFQDEIGRRKLKIVRDIVGYSNRQKAAAAMKTFLDEHQPFDALFAENDHMALGAIDAMKSRHLAPWPIVVGYDGVPEALDAMKKGEMAATISQDPVLLGEKAATTLSRIIKGEKFDPVTMILPHLITRESIPAS